jgi:hypothetical protein
MIAVIPLGRRGQNRRAAVFDAELTVARNPSKLTRLTSF